MEAGVVDDVELKAMSWPPLGVVVDTVDSPVVRVFVTGVLSVVDVLGIFEVVGLVDAFLIVEAFGIVGVFRVVDVFVVVEAVVDGVEGDLVMSEDRVDSVNSVDSLSTVVLGWVEEVF